MRIAIIAEGIPDQAVLSNIIHGIFKGMDIDIYPLRPDASYDATDIKLRDDAAAGGLARIKKDCEEKTLFEGFFALDFDEKDKLIIQTDTAEIEEYGVVRPTKKNNKDYTKILRSNTIEKIKTEWLNNDYSEQLLFAISIEELEAWVLPLYENKDSTTSMNPKKKLKSILSKKNINSVEEYNNYQSISNDFKKIKKLESCFKYNESLELFCLELNALKDSLEIISSND